MQALGRFYTRPQPPADKEPYHPLSMLSESGQTDSDYQPQILPHVASRQSLSEETNTPSKDILLPNRKSVQSPPPVIPPREDFVSSVVPLFKLFVLPCFAIAYLAFCYTVHWRIVSVNTGNLINDSVTNIDFIKSGVTSISIIIITLGLYPVHSLISELKSEEFFRAVSGSGAPLAAVNGISIPSFGFLGTFVVLLRKYCSLYFYIAFITSFLALAASTLAPAALSVSTALFDGDVVAFAVGAIYRDDIINVTSQQVDQLPGPNVSSLAARAAQVAWVESSLGVAFSFQVDNESYIVPPPIDLPLDTPAKWLSDILVINPQCEWSNATINRTTPDPLLEGLTILINLADDLDYTITTAVDFSLASSVNSAVDFNNLIFNLWNHTNTGFPISGAAVWVFSQCTNNCTDNALDDNITFDLTGIPTVSISNVGTNSGGTFEVGFLLCNPNAVIETREIRNDGHGVMTVLDGAFPVSQGNLQRGQTGLMLTGALGSLGGNGGPVTQSSIGGEAQATMLFGSGVSNLTTDLSGEITIKPLPVANITASYQRLLQSATKIFLQGSLSRAYVPGRVSTEKLIFRSSLPQVIVSTVLFIALTIIAILCHFRKETRKFTLFSVAASLHESDIPAAFARVANEAHPGASETDLVAVFGRRSITSMQTGEDSLVLRLQ